MADDSLNPSQCAAMRDLLDDTSPVVRDAMLKRFGDLGPAAKAFLDEVAHGNNRALAWHAKWFLEELRFTDPVGDFRAFINSLHYELESGALLLARTVRPGIDVGGICAELDRIAQRCRQLIVEPSSPRQKCGVINRVLFHEGGFHGNLENYSDPDNSFLDQVLLRRTGMPIALGTVYLLVAQRLGLDLEPVGLPGYFMVGCYLEERPFFIDCFHGGQIRDVDMTLLLLRAQGYKPIMSDLAPIPVREVLARTCRNAANHFRSTGDDARALLFAGFVDAFEATYQRNL